MMVYYMMVVDKTATLLQRGEPQYNPTTPWWFLAKELFLEGP